MNKNFTSLTIDCLYLSFGDYWSQKFLNLGYAVYIKVVFVLCGTKSTVTISHSCRLCAKCLNSSCSGHVLEGRHVQTVLYLSFVVCTYAPVQSTFLVSVHYYIIHVLHT
jgi:hypothetical protein